MQRLSLTSPFECPANSLVPSLLRSSADTAPYCPTVDKGQRSWWRKKVQTGSKYGRNTTQLLTQEYRTILHEDSRLSTASPPTEVVLCHTMWNKSGSIAAVFRLTVHISSFEIGTEHTFQLLISVCEREEGSNWTRSTSRVVWVMSVWT